MRRNILYISLMLTCFGTKAQANENIEQYFTAYLQNNNKSYTINQRIRWQDVNSYRATVWQAWCKANTDFDEERLPALRPLTNTDTLLWHLPESLEPNATMPYYYGTKGKQPEKGWPL